MAVSKRLCGETMLEQFNSCQKVVGRGMNRLRGNERL